MYPCTVFAGVEGRGEPTCCNVSHPRTGFKDAFVVLSVQYEMDGMRTDSPRGRNTRVEGKGHACRLGEKGTWRAQGVLRTTARLPLPEARPRSAGRDAEGRQHPCLFQPTYM